MPRLSQFALVNTGGGLPSLLKRYARWRNSQPKLSRTSLIALTWFSTRRTSRLLLLRANTNQLQSAIRCLNGLLESLEKLQGSSTTTEQELKAINSSTRKQLQLSRKVVTSLEQSADISKRNRTKAEGANWTATTLGKVGQQLEKFAEHFQPMQKSPRLQETDNVSDLDSTSSIESELVTQ